jgi:hypothetical protein
LPKPEAMPAQVKSVELPPTELLFTLRSIRWTDSRGVKQTADPYTDAALPPDIARRALTRRVCVATSDPRRRELLHAHGGRHPNPEYAFDLDDEESCRSLHVVPAMVTDSTALVEPAIVRV